MMTITGFEIREQLYQGLHFSIYRAIREKDNLPCILKYLDRTEDRTSNVIDDLKKEYRFLKKITSPHVINALDFIHDKKDAFIVMEDVQGTPLKELITDSPIPARDFISFAISITRGLTHIHSQGIIHKDINPTNIIFTPNRNIIKIIDFNIASTYDIKVSYTGNPEELHGTLPYISPEQTGRMNRRVDHRSDLYSLGITFYEMLTGQLPFRHRTPIELVYDHMARPPEVPRLVNPLIPEILSEILLKLLAKNPEERYQSTEGLLHDLEKCRDRNFEEFPLAQKDFSGKLQIPEKLYGREKEIKQLMDAYHSVTQGANKLVLVTGYSGTGKSALVNEIHKPISRDRGYFIRGKFDRLKRSVPYFAFIQAFDRFCQLLLSEKQEVIEIWKERILEAVGKLGRVLTDIIPQLKTVIGEQPEVPEVGGGEAKKRFNYVFLRFVEAVSYVEHPLVIFIDDLQWADVASLDLLQVLIEDRQNQYIFIIGAYRDNEITPSHPLTATLQDIANHHIPIETIPIQNLSWENLHQWMCNTLMISPTRTATNGDDIAALTDLIHQKTQGNAFFTIQFIKNLYETNLLRFDFTVSKWKWYLNEIQEQNITDNVVELLVQKIQSLPIVVQTTLTLAACIGSIFDLDTLTVISDKSRNELEKDLETAIKEHLVYPLEDGEYKFAHDRFHQAAYMQISGNDKKALHLTIGRLLLKNRSSAHIQESAIKNRIQTFTIVNHLNIGIALMVEDDEKLQLVRLNLESSQKAKLSGAYKLASEYIYTAILLLPPDCWEQYYTLALAIYNEAVQTSFLCGNFDEMEAHIKTILEQAKDISHTSTAHEYRLISLMAQNQPHRAVEALLEIFSQLGIPIPLKTNKLKIRGIMRRTHSLLKKKKGQALIDLPIMMDSHKQMASRLFFIASNAFAYAAQEVILYVIGKMVDTILEYGHTQESPLILSAYGTKIVYLGDIPGAYRLGEAALELLERGIGTPEVRHRAVFISCIYILGNKKHFKKICRIMNDTYRQAQELGDVYSSGYMLTNYIMCISRTDTPLSQVYEKAKSTQDTVVALKQPILLPPLTIEISACSSLLGQTSDPGELDLQDLNELIKNMQEDTRKLYNWQIYIKKIILALLFERYQNLTQYISAAEENWKDLTSPIIYIKSDFYFYVPLAYLQLAGQNTTTKNDRKKFIAKAKKYLLEMKEWSRFGPVNFLHKYYLLQAELYRVLGKKDLALSFYEKAIEKAYENDYLNEAALANEWAAKFHLQRGQTKLAAVYFLEARNGYTKWGAIAKVKHLESAYPRYLSLGSSGSSLIDRSISSSSSETASEMIDVKSLLKASQTLSGEVQLKGLLEHMIQILIENAGAQRCVLIENNNDQLLVQAEGSTEGITGSLQELPVEKSSIVPLSIINYVAHSKQQLVFDNVSLESRYATDPFIQQHRTCSVVCFPILSKGQLSSIIYLENNLIEGVFTPARLEILNMLSAQIAISVENTHLYENLEEKVKQRTLQLQRAKDDLERNHIALELSHKKINDSVNYASKIQEAVLPSQETLSQLFPSHFLIYKPCSVVSGDFYWLRQIDDKVIVATADCTGHGVPGALLSMLGMAFLNEIVPLLALQNRMAAANILDQIRLKVKTALKQQGRLSDQKEGMDMALCIIDPVNHQLQFAGAQLPLYLIRNKELIEIKGNKMPIGIHRKELAFTNHDIQFHENDMIYLFSDGYADQLGEETNEKFMKGHFKNVLLEIHHLPASKQKQILLNRLAQWQGNFPQVDDILVLGIRL